MGISDIGRRTRVEAILEGLAASADIGDTSQPGESQVQGSGDQGIPGCLSE